MTVSFWIASLNLWWASRQTDFSTHLASRLWYSLKRFFYIFSYLFFYLFSCLSFLMPAVIPFKAAWGQPVLFSWRPLRGSGGNKQKRGWPETGRLKHRMKGLWTPTSCLSREKALFCATLQVFGGRNSVCRPGRDLGLVLNRSWTVERGQQPTLLLTGFTMERSLLSLTRS